MRLFAKITRRRRGKLSHTPEITPPWGSESGGFRVLSRVPRGGGLAGWVLPVDSVPSARRHMPSIASWWADWRRRATASDATQHNDMNVAEVRSSVV